MCAVAPLVHGQCLVFGAAARVGVDRTRLRMLIAGRFAQMLSLERLSLCTGAAPSRLGGAFVGFSLSALCFGSLLLS